jgi:hypothetical protein
VQDDLDVGRAAVLGQVEAEVGEAVAIRLGGHADAHELGREEVFGGCRRGQAEAGQHQHEADEGCFHVWVPPGGNRRHFHELPESIPRAFPLEFD